jgi:hypothetical protein
MGFSNAASRSTAAEYFKRVYAKANLVPITTRETPTLKHITMMEHAFGEAIIMPVVTDMPVGASASMAQAINNAAGSKTKKFVLDPKSFFAAVNVPALDQALSEKNEAAYLQLKKQEMDNNLVYMGQRFEKMLWGDGNGDLAQVSSVTNVLSVYTLTLSAGGALFFHKGQKILFNTSRVANAVLNKNCNGEVITVNDNTDVITVTVSGADVPAANDYVFVDGDHGIQNAAAQSLLLTGIPAYIPAFDPGTGSVPAILNGLDRSDRPALLAGWRGQDEGSIVSSAKSLIARMGRYSKIGPKTAFMMSYNNWRRLESELADKAWRDQKAEAVFNTGAISVLTPKGAIPAIAIPALDDSACFFGDLASVKLRHVKKFPHLREDGGVSSTRLDWGNSQDGERFEFRAWAETCIDDPGAWGRFPVTPA